MRYLAAALPIVGFHGLLPCRRHLSTFPGIVTKSKALPMSGPIQRKHELDIRISYDLALLIVAFLPSFNLTFLAIGVITVSLRIIGRRKVANLSKAFFRSGLNIITDFRTVGHQLAAVAYHHLLSLLIAVTVIHGCLPGKPVLYISIIIKFNKLIKLI